MSADFVVVPTKMRKVSKVVVEGRIMLSGGILQA
jgi:hypothetical protein